MAKSFGWACGALAGYAHAFWHNRRRSERQAVPLKPPTRDELVRHLEKFGPEGVQELADSLEIDLAAETRKPTAAEKRRAHALTLLDEGKSAEDIAATKSVNVETARRWKRESEGMPENVQRVRGRGPKRRSTMRPRVQQWRGFRVGADFRVGVDEPAQEDRVKSVTPKARAQRRATIAQRLRERREAVIYLRQEKRLVPEAIADYLGISDGQVRTYLREAKRSRTRGLGILREGARVV